MTNIFQLGLTALRERANIERAIKLSQPVLDAYNANRSVVNDVKHMIDELEQLKTKVQPIVDAYMAVDDELVPLTQHLSQAFYPHEVKQASRPVHVPAEGFNVRWLQQSLVDLAKAGKFHWVSKNPKTGRTIHQEGFADDKLGDNTQVEVEAYQQAKLDAGTAGWTKSDVDGWAGMQTCAAIYNDLASP